MACGQVLIYSGISCYHLSWDEKPRRVRTALAVLYLQSWLGASGFLEDRTGPLFSLLLLPFCFFPPFFDRLPAQPERDYSYQVHQFINPISAIFNLITGDQIISLGILPFGAVARNLAPPRSNNDEPVETAIPNYQIDDPAPAPLACFLGLATARLARIPWVGFHDTMSHQPTLSPLPPLHAKCQNVLCAHPPMDGDLEPGKMGTSMGETKLPEEEPAGSQPPSYARRRCVVISQFCRHL